LVAVNEYEIYIGFKMKVSKVKKEEIRKKLLDSAIEIISKKGFKHATMNEISKKAGLSPATIYKYFSTKEHILFAYLEMQTSELDLRIKKTPGFDSFDLKEKLQLYIETLLELYLPHRDFVSQAYKLVFDSPFTTFSEILPIKKAFVGNVESYIDEAISKKEIPNMPLKSAVSNLIWDYYGFIIMFWIKDKSEAFEDTSQLIDKTLDIFIEILKSGMITKAMDLIVFFIRSKFHGGLDLFQKLSQAFTCKDCNKR